LESEEIGTMEHTKKFDTLTKFAEAEAVQLEAPEKEWLDQVYGKIEEKIQDLLGTNKESSFFDILFTPKSDYSNPLDANNFFNSLHPRNYKTLPYLELDSEKLSTNLRIIPIKGRMTR